MVKKSDGIAPICVGRMGVDEKKKVTDALNLMVKDRLFQVL